MADQKIQLNVRHETGHNIPEALNRVPDEWAALWERLILLPAGPIIGSALSPLRILYKTFQVTHADITEVAEFIEGAVHEALKNDSGDPSKAVIYWRKWPELEVMRDADSSRIVYKATCRFHVSSQEIPKDATFDQSGEDLIAEVKAAIDGWHKENER